MLGEKYRRWKSAAKKIHHNKGTQHWLKPSKWRETQRNPRQSVTFMRDSIRISLKIDNKNYFKQWQFSKFVTVLSSSNMWSTTTYCCPRSGLITLSDTLLTVAYLKILWIWTWARKSYKKLYPEAIVSILIGHSDVSKKTT